MKSIQVTTLMIFPQLDNSVIISGNLQFYGTRDLYLTLLHGNGFRNMQLWNHHPISLSIALTERYSVWIRRTRAIPWRPSCMRRQVMYLPWIKIFMFSMTTKTSTSASSIENKWYILCVRRKNQNVKGYEWKMFPNYCPRCHIDLPYYNGRCSLDTLVNGIV